MPEATMDSPMRRARPGVFGRLRTWFDHHVYSFVASLGRIARKPWSTLLTVGVMAIALAMPLGLWLVLANVARFSGDVQQSRQVSVFLQPQLTVAQAQALAQTLRGRGDIGDVELRTPAQGLAELRAGGLGDAIDAAGSNPLPSLLIVTPKGDEGLLVASLQRLPEADFVQHDAVWRQRLDGWLRFGYRLALVLGVLLGLGALLVVGNTVRLDIQSRREEIEVLQHLGATDGFIRRPFLYLGAWYGLMAGAFAIGLLTLAALALRAPLSDLATGYGSHFTLAGLDPATAAAVVVAAAFLGWLGAGAVTGHFLRQTRPAPAGRESR
jgi:cell division transport system permease protein